MAFRKDLLLISSWIKPNTKVLDLFNHNIDDLFLS